jgi:hypothetical protein
VSDLADLQGGAVMADPPELSSRAEKAYSFVQEVAKQLTTLSTGIFALTLTFAEKLEKPGAHARVFLEFGWGLFLISILFGIFVLMALAGHIEDPPGGHDTIYARGITFLGYGQIVVFIAALILTLIYGVKAA